MDARIQTLSSLFSSAESYRIPVFQRPYAWTKERQWEPLWNDVKHIAQRLLDDPDEDIPPHFMGAIVLQLQSANSGQVVKRIIVDGQQRLTTLQLLIRAAQDCFQNLDDNQRANRMSRLTVNDSDYWGDNNGNETKVRQANENDLQSFQDVIRGLIDDSRSQRAIGQAFQYFKKQIAEWLNEVPTDRELRSDSLERTITEQLQLATVDLDTGEKPHFIFSVLNARAEPLKESDHIKNTVMFQSNVVDDAAKAKQLWGIFDSNEWWRVSTREGRISRIHLDRFLNYWLIMRSGKEVTADNVSSEFNKYLDSCRLPMEEVAADIRRAGLVYQDLEEARLHGIQTFLRRMKTMELGVAMPLLLWVFTSQLTNTQHKRIVVALESYLVRRMLCNFGSQGLNKLFVELLARSTATDPQAVDQSIIDHLRGQTVDNRIWPGDTDLRNNLIGRPLRGSVSRQTMVLEAIELDRRTDKTEDLGQSQLTLEHIMPKSWERNWPLPDGRNGDEEAKNRDQAISEIGNLTLVTGKLNATLSNSP